MEYLYGKSFSLANFDQEARHLSHLSPCQPLPDINWGRGREMKDSLDTAQCAGTTCQAAEHTEPRRCPAGTGSTEFLLCLLPSLPKGQPALAPPASRGAGRHLLQHSQPPALAAAPVLLEGEDPTQRAGLRASISFPGTHIIPFLLGTRDSLGRKDVTKISRSLLPSTGLACTWGHQEDFDERKEERPMPPKACLQWESTHSQTSPGSMSFPKGRARALPEVYLGPQFSWPCR